MTSGKVRFSGLDPFSTLDKSSVLGTKKYLRSLFSISFQKRSRNSIYCRCLFPTRWKVGNSWRGAKRTKFHVRESTRWRCNGRRERSRAIFQRKCKDYIELSQTDGELPSAARLKTLKTAANAKTAKFSSVLLRNNLQQQKTAFLNGYYKCITKLHHEQTVSVHLWLKLTNLN